jgi:hypothetical protein
VYSILLSVPNTTENYKWLWLVKISWAIREDIREFSRGLLTTIRGISGITERKTTKKSQSSRSPHRDIKMAHIQYEAENTKSKTSFGLT